MKSELKDEKFIYDMEQRETFLSATVKINKP